MSLDIQTYSPIPSSVTISIENYKTVIKESVSNHGVRWLVSKRVNAPVIDSSNNALNSGRRRKDVAYVFKEYYVCHRSGSRRERADVVKGGVSGQVRTLRKKSKKIQCPGTLKVTCFKKTPSVVTIVHSDNHNHTIGSNEDLPYLPASVSNKSPH